jgi:hypothetical protein
MRPRSDGFFRRAGGVLLGASLLLAPAARAQGTLTGELPDAIPTDVALRLGSFSLTPILTVQQIGSDNNVFDEPNNPKKDFVVALTPTVRAYLDGAHVQVVSEVAGDFVYYQKYASERSIARRAKGRMDLMLGHLKPSVAAAYLQTRERPTHEIDLRARRSQREVSASVAYEFSPGAHVAATVSRIAHDYAEGEVFRGTDLNFALTRGEETAGVRFRMPLTPLTSFQVETSLSRDRFDRDTRRNTDSRRLSAGLQFGEEAVIRGRARVGYRDFRSVDPTVHPFQGLTADVGLAVVIASVTHIDVRVQRDVEYSFDGLQAYYVGSGGAVTATHRLFGPVDIQVRYDATRLQYGQREGIDDRRDSLQSYGGGFGYTLKDRTRIGINYEYTRRRSTLPEARYERPRVFVSWSYVF